MMIKVIGSVCVLLGCLLPTRQRIQREQDHIHQLSALEQSLDRIRRRLVICAPPMEELLEQASHSIEETVSRFFASFQLTELEQRPFAALWDNAIRESRLLLDREEYGLLSEVGQVLGSYDLEEQCGKLEGTVQELCRCRRQREKALRENTRLWYTLSASAGLLAVLILF